MILFRPIFFEVVAHSVEQTTGFDDFLADHYPTIKRIGGRYYLFSTLRFDELNKSLNTFSQIRDIIFEMDRYAERNISAIASCFDLKYYLYSSLMDSFHILVQVAEKDSFISLDISQHRVFMLRIDRPVDPENALPIFIDRPECAQLIGSASNAVTPAGQLSGYVRLFEAAFNMSHNALKKPLHQFLSTNNLEYSKKESDKWIEMRHGLSHADRMENVLYDSDAFAYIIRIKQAAYDVCLNKQTWRDPSTHRRSGNALTCTIGASKNVTATQGVYTCLNPFDSDFFGRYPTIPSRNSQGADGSFKVSDLVADVEKQHPSVKIVGTFGQNGFQPRQV